MLSSSSVSFSRRSSSIAGEKKNENPPLTTNSMLVGLQQLQQRIIATPTTTTCHNTGTQLPSVRSISYFVRCDITIDDIQQVKQESINQKVDLKMDVNESQKLTAPTYHLEVPSLLHFCKTGNLMIIKVLFLSGANCTQLYKKGNVFQCLLLREKVI